MSDAHATPGMHQLNILGLLAAVKKLGPAEYRMSPQAWAAVIIGVERAAEFLGEIENRRLARLAREAEGMS